MKGKLQVVYIVMLIIGLAVLGFFRARIVYRGNEVKYAKIFLVMLPFLVVSAGRYMVGRDYLPYTVSYYDFGNGSVGREWEILGTAVIQIARLFQSRHLIIVLYAVLFCGITFMYIEDQSINKGFSLLLLVLSGTYFESLTMMRQSVSTAIFIYVSKYAFEKQYKKFVFGIIIASFFHKTALVYMAVFLIFILLNKLLEKHEKKIKLVCLVLLASSTVYTVFLRNIIYAFALKFKFYYRAFQSVYDHGNYSISLLLAAVPIFLVMSLAEIYARERTETENRKMSMYYLVCFLGAWSAVLLPIIPNGERIVHLFTPLEIVSLPYVILHIGWRKKALGKIVRFFCTLAVVLCLTVTTYHYYYANNTVDVFPYQFIW